MDRFSNGLRKWNARDAAQKFGHHWQSIWTLFKSPKNQFKAETSGTSAAIPSSVALYNKSISRAFLPGGGGPPEKLTHFSLTPCSRRETKEPSMSGKERKSRKMTVKEIKNINKIGFSDFSNTFPNASLMEKAGCVRAIPCLASVAANGVRCESLFVITPKTRPDPRAVWPTAPAPVRESKKISRIHPKHQPT